MRTYWNWYNVGIFDEVLRQAQDERVIDSVCPDLVESLGVGFSIPFVVRLSSTFVVSLSNHEWTRLV
jgi:hypothetical protein